MRREKLSLGKILLLCAGAAVAVIAIALTLKLAQSVKKPLYNEAAAAAEKMQQCMNAVKLEKQNREIAIPEEDTFSTGMLGEDFNFITTTLGDVQAKRTSADPDMAALMVFMLDETGLKSGDVLACNFSGSFPSLNIATICACETLGITPVYICSCGASTWGANNPEFSFPEMAVMLYEGGLIDTPPALITPGGGDDTGSGVDSLMFEEIWNRVCALGYPVMVERDYNKNINARIKLFDEAGADAFIAVGGNITSLGNNMIVDTIGQGILKDKIYKTNSGSGLIEIYLNRGTPVMLLLNIKKLCADYGMPFDSGTRTAIGEGSIYFETRYPNLIILAALVIEAVIFIQIKRKDR